jgi:membrane-bound ClpP family serine protease
MTDEQSADGDAGGDRDVVVPFRVYKTVTVFSTLFAVVSVVGGFILVDRATERATVPASEIDPVVALAGIGLIVFGAAVYAFATRFRTEEMGKSKDDAAEDSGNG